MSNRRNFIRKSLLAGPAFWAACNMPAEKKGRKDSPVVISTWDFGKEANAEAWKKLMAGSRAVDAVEVGVRVTEADPGNSSVGFGGLPDRDGKVTLDACIMDEFYNCGAVMFLQDILHPVSVARMVMEKTPHVMLAGEGALQFALQNGFERTNLLTPESEKAWKEWLKTSQYEPVVNIENLTNKNRHAPMPGGPDNHDTIGMIALDAHGNLGGACTTSGMAYKLHGRIGDSPIIGAGLYVDNEVGAVTATGVGEEVVRIVGAHLVTELMRQGYGPKEACKVACERIIKRNPEKAKAIQVGFIALDKEGNYGAYALQKGFTYAVKSGEVDQLFTAESIF